MKGSINSSIPGDVHTVIADGMFIIQTSLKGKTPTFAIIKGFETYKTTWMFYVF